MIKKLSAISLMLVSTFASAEYTYPAISVNLHYTQPITESSAENHPVADSVQEYVSVYANIYGSGMHSHQYIKATPESPYKSFTLDSGAEIHNTINTEIVQGATFYSNETVVQNKRTSQAKFYVHRIDGNSEVGLDCNGNLSHVRIVATDEHGTEQSIQCSGQTSNIYLTMENVRDIDIYPTVQ
ncbi:hypothetical protein [Vibrio coralliilyticus]|uniref:hypothetical protein n=1 Tax=Vibrio coralliilyticus TaxID=190893 RepID=UPI002FD0E1D2